MIPKSEHAFWCRLNFCYILFLCKLVMKLKVLWFTRLALWSNIYSFCVRFNCSWFLLLFRIPELESYEQPILTICQLQLNQIAQVYQIKFIFAIKITHLKKLLQWFPMFIFFLYALAYFPHWFFHKRMIHRITAPQ